MDLVTKDKKTGLYSVETKAMNDPVLSEFIPFEKDQNQSTVQEKQDGANCGCFAAGMAIKSILATSQTIPTSQIAKIIEANGVMHGISSLGEFFDADELTKAINLFAEVNNLDQQNKKILAKTAHFDDLKRFTDIITESLKRGVRVLIPYYADGKSGYGIKKPGNNRANGEEMRNAHWAVIDRIDPISGKILLRESSQDNTNPVLRTATFQNLFDSNKSLGDIFDWNEYKPSQKEIPLLNNRIQKESSMIENEKRIYDTNDVLPPVLDNSLIEPVNLSGRIVLVGVMNPSFNEKGNSTGSTSGGMILKKRKDEESKKVNKSIKK